jgi:hypothetical protein
MTIREPLIGLPDATEYAPYYQSYIARVTEPDVLDVLARQVDDVRAAALAVAPERESFRYAPGKWSMREVFGHVTDAERVFGYRAFSISRGDRAAFPGFDENDYVARSPFADCPVAELADEFALIRRANLSCLRRLDGARWRLAGTANDRRVSVRALAYIMAGHVRHHLAVLAERYGAPA